MNEIVPPQRLIVDCHRKKRQIDKIVCLDAPLLKYLPCLERCSMHATRQQRARGAVIWIRKVGAVNAGFDNGVRFYRPDR